MHRSEIKLTYEALGKILDLPPDTFVSGIVDDNHQHGVFQIRIMSERKAPEEFSIDDGDTISFIASLANIGDAYRNPANYPAKKGCCLSAFEGFQETARPGDSSCSD